MRSLPKIQITSRPYSPTNTVSQRHLHHVYFYQLGPRFICGWVVSGHVDRKRTDLSPSRASPSRGLDHIFIVMPDMIQKHCLLTPIIIGSSLYFTRKMLSFRMVVFTRHAVGCEKYETFKCKTCQVWSVIVCYLSVCLLSDKQGLLLWVRLSLLPPFPRVMLPCGLIEPKALSLWNNIGTKGA